MMFERTDGEWAAWIIAEFEKLEGYPVRGAIEAGTLVSIEGADRGHMLAVALDEVGVPVASINVSAPGEPVRAYIARRKAA